MKLKLDTKTIARLALKQGESELFAWDSELTGFGLRLRRRHDGGVLRSWTAQYRSDGKSRRFTLGSVEKVGLGPAREQARKILAGAQLGYDPQAEKQSKRARAARTFSAVADAYLAARQDALRPSSLRLARLYLTSDYFRSLHGMSVTEISHADIAASLSRIARRHSVNTAAAARRTVSGMLRWAVEEGWVPANPVIGTRKPPREKPRERVLSNSELVAVWRACGDDDFGRIVRLLVLLGSRRVEVGGMAWSELDLDTGVWTLPAERSKNHRAHSITLPPAALAIITDVPRRARAELFGSAWAKGRGFSTWSRCKTALDAQLPDLPPWTLHDIRRTVATGMIDIGIEPHHVEAVLNHHGGHRSGVAGVYNQSTYQPAIKSALLRWSAHVDDLLAGRKTNVTALHRA
jgi:integrase